MKRITPLAAIAVNLLLQVGAQAAPISLTNAQPSYQQNFDSLPNATSTGTAWVNDGTLAGWFLYDSVLGDVTSIRVDAGGSSSGGFRSYGVANTTDRALGAQGTDSFEGWIAAAFRNDTGVTLSGFTLSFDGEQWRRGADATNSTVHGRVDTMVLEYGFGPSFAAVSQWTAPGGSFNWTSPVATISGGASGGAGVSGNGAGLVAGRGGNIATNWTAGSTLWLRWVEHNDPNYDHGLAIDNVQLSVSAVPEPQAGLLLAAGLAVVGFVARRRRDR